MLDLRVRIRKALWKGGVLLWMQIDMFVCLWIHGHTERKM